MLIGGSGFLGKYLLEELLKQDYYVVATQHKSILHEKHNLHILKGGIKSVSKKQIDKFKPEVIFHVARPAMPALKKVGRHIAARRAGKLNDHLLQQLLISNTKPKLIFASGSLVYGNSNQAHVEDSALNPISYARQYIRGELPFIKAAKHVSYPVCLLRFPWLLGNGSWFKWFYLKNILDHNAVPLFGNGQNFMNIIDVEDAVKLVMDIGKQAEIKPIRNICSPFNLSQKEFASLLADEFNCVVKDFRSIYSHRLEKEILEAFQSNILLTSKYPQIIENFNYTGILKTLSKLRSVYPGS